MAMMVVAALTLYSLKLCNRLCISQNCINHNHVIDVFSSGIAIGFCEVLVRE